MSTQRETTSESESGSERFAPKAHEQVSDAPDSSLAAVVSDDDRLDRLSRMAGTDTCDLCRERLPCRVLEHGLCRRCRE